MKKKFSLGTRSHFFLLIQSNSANFCCNDIVLLRFIVTKKKKMPILFLPQAISFQSCFFVCGIIFSKKIAQGEIAVSSTIMQIYYPFCYKNRNFHFSYQNEKVKKQTFIYSFCFVTITTVLKQSQNNGVEVRVFSNYFISHFFISEI